MSQHHRLAADVRERTKVLCHAVRIAVPSIHQVLEGIDVVTRALVRSSDRRVVVEALELCRASLEHVRGAADKLEAALEAYEASL